MIEEAQVIVHEADEPNVVVDFNDADVEYDGTDIYWYIAQHDSLRSTD